MKRVEPSQSRPLREGLARRPQEVRRGYAIVGVLMALLITSLGAVTTARVLSAIALQQRAHQQELAVASALYDAMETGGSAFAVGEDSGQRILLEDGTPVLFERTNHHWPEQGDPRGGQHRYLTARWTDPWGLRQERTLRTYWWPAPRIY